MSEMLWTVENACNKQNCHILTFAQLSYITFTEQVKED